MSTGSISLDILLSKIQESAIADSNDALRDFMQRYPSLSEKQAKEIILMITAASKKENDSAQLVLTAPPSFANNAQVTKIVVEEMINKAKRNILFTGYSLSDYFSDLIDCIVQKSQEGVFVKFFVNDIEHQNNIERLLRYKGKYLKIYNYPKGKDSMAALHAKVISIDNEESLITSANLSYHGQQGNIELGTHIFSQKTAKQIDEIFTTLLFSKVFVEV